jgi:hypothetical protein
VSSGMGGGSLGIEGTIAGIGGGAAGIVTIIGNGRGALGSSSGALSDSIGASALLDGLGLTEAVVGGRVRADVFSAYSPRSSSPFPSKERAAHGIVSTRSTTVSNRLFFTIIPHVFEFQASRVGNC